MLFTYFSFYYSLDIQVIASYDLDMFVQENNKLKSNSALIISVLTVKMYYLFYYV